MNPVRPPTNAPSTTPTARATSQAYELLRNPPIVTSSPKKAIIPSVWTSAMV